MINVLDTETYEEDTKIIIYCICLILNNKIKTFYDTKNIVLEALNYIVNEAFDTITELFIHNLNFDGMLIINVLSKNFIKYELVINKTNLYSLKIYYCNKIIIFKCSYKIIPLSLNKLGDIENMPKTKFPYKFVNKSNLYYEGSLPDKIYWENDDYCIYNKTFSGNFSVKDETLKYCINDVILTQKVLINLFRIMDEESKSIRKKVLSLPSASHKIFYKKYNNFLIDENIKLEDDSYIRSSYFGGRCEVYGNIKNDEYVKYYDFSGMYGQCMMEPFHFGEYTYEKPTSFIKPGFYNITYISDIQQLPVLPMHYNDKLIFCNGTATGTFWFEEIKLFEEMGGKILSINNALLYNNYDKVFLDFVNKFTLIRKKEGYYKVFGKLMINSLYGSMALKHREDEQYITFSEEEFVNIYKNTTVINFYKIEACYIIIIKNDYKSKNYFKNSKKSNQNFVKRNISYASAIASKARIKLYRAMMDVLKDGGRLLYCDTDSIFAAYKKTDNRVKTTNFDWLEFYDDAVFISPKTYATKNQKEVIKIKGISYKNINFDELKTKFYNAENICFNDQLIFRKTNFDLKQLYINKFIFVDNYDKRKFINNKKDTEPLIIFL